MLSLKPQVGSVTLSESINQLVSNGLEAISESFVFRKLGVCYDYRAASDSFPLKTLPRSNEIAESKPNDSGEFSGMYDSVLNNALLFDGYALRLEMGFAQPQEERIFDRLIGGAIRFSTIAPRNATIRGLAPDGRSFYKNPGIDAYLAWAFYAWRVATTSVVALESQEKIKNITARWIQRIVDAEYKIMGDDTALLGESYSARATLGAILAVAYDLGKHEKWKKEFLEKFDLSGALAADATIAEIMQTQMALFLISKVFHEEEQGKLAQQEMCKLLPLAARSLEDYKKIDSALFEDMPLPDWRQIEENGQKPDSWKRIQNEEASVKTSVQAAWVILLSEDEVAIKPYAEKIIALLQETEWGKLFVAASISPLAAIHARGVSYELWDKELSEYTLSFDGAGALVEPFMSDNYDKENAEKTGHIEAPEKKEIAAEYSATNEKPKSLEKKKNKRRRRKRRRKPTVGADK